MANCEHFEKACQGIQAELASQKTFGSRSKFVTLEAADRFKAARYKAEQRIFELIRSKINDLTETAEYDW